VGWAVGWDNLTGAPVAFSSAQLAPGDPGLDTSSAGVLALGAVNATQVDVDPDLLFSSHLISNAAGVPATSALGANVTSATFTGNDTRGTIAIVMAGALAANTAVCTVTFAVSYGATSPKVTLVDQTSGVGLAVVNSYVLSQATGVSFVIAFDSALALGTYTIDYIVIG
jgi:hypothetical protein